jgi:ketosteroid isomerase-like protein
MRQSTATSEAVHVMKGQGERARGIHPAIGLALGVLAWRWLLSRALLAKLRRDVRALNAGDYQPLLAGYAQDAVLRFNEGEHRWAGEHRGKPAIARFLRNFVAAGLQGEVTELFLAGPPWRLTLLVRFDDHAHGPAGEELYRNRTVLIARTRCAKIVLQEDFYEDTVRIGALDARLSALGVGASR